MSASAGRVLIIHKGAYDNSATYSPMDSVLYNGSSYVCKVTSTGNEPTDTDYWQIYAQGTSVSRAGSYYGTCDTASGTAEKVVTVPASENFVLQIGDILMVTFTNGNTATSPQLNVNSSGAKNINYEGTQVTSAHLWTAGKAGGSSVYVYDGTEWVWLAHDSMDASEIDYGNSNVGTALDGKSDKVMDIISSYQSTANYSTLADRISVVTSVNNSLNLADGEKKQVIVEYREAQKVRYTFWRRDYSDRHKIQVEEVNEYQGIYRQYAMVSTVGTFSQTLEYRNYFSSKSFTATVKTFTGITIPTTSIVIFPTYSVFSGGYTVGSSTVTLQSDFQVGSYYYYIFATFGSDAESTFADVANDTILSSPPVLYIYNNQLSQTNLRIIKHNNKIYVAYRSTNSSQSFQAGLKAQSMYAAISNSAVFANAYFKD